MLDLNKSVPVVVLFCFTYTDGRASVVLSPLPAHHEIDLLCEETLAARPSILLPHLHKSVIRSILCGSCLPNVRDSLKAGQYHAAICLAGSRRR